MYLVHYLIENGHTKFEYFKSFGKAWSRFEEVTEQYGPTESEYVNMCLEAMRDGATYLCDETVMLASLLCLA